MKFNTTKYTSIFFVTLALTTLLQSAVLAQPETPNGTSEPTNTEFSSTPSNSTSILRQLNLSEQQKQQIWEILSRRSRQIRLVLTPAQRTRLEQDLSSGTRLDIALMDANINDGQKEQVASIIRKTNQEIATALNPQQRQQVKAYLEQESAPEMQVPIAY
ncbi:hypothetical protein QUB80_17255 [Chlorogloeopsis sp. ULAP01]|uniref:hypothetical protein n=1 Tax=Chlorogloeopsis sp. ULAP01 TaxID=3056483 RepID=UPI0025AAC03D|nr:hypothetical protein [Chlorogloeopsis sp. ULAP01]MDM9382452.1 hypothetical protein [Chlorogloeopsis sp. ULAP01]